MKSVSLAAAIILSGVFISACDNTVQQDAPEKVQSSDNIGANNKRESKLPGCQTLIDMGQLENMEILNVSNADLDTVLKKTIEKYASEESVLVLQNKNTINSCTIHQIHFKDIPQSPTSPKQAILVFLEDKQLGGLTSAGAKVTCWKDPVEKWYPLSECK